jgi:hypothetical protein
MQSQVKALSIVLQIFQVSLVQVVWQVMVAPLQQLSYADRMA